MSGINRRSAKQTLEALANGTLLITSLNKRQGQELAQTALRLISKTLQNPEVDVHDVEIAEKYAHQKQTLVIANDDNHALREENARLHRLINRSIAALKEIT